MKALKSKGIRSGILKSWRVLKKEKVVKTYTNTSQIYSFSPAAFEEKRCSFGSLGN